MRILVFLEHYENELATGPLGLLAHVASLGADEVGAIVIGDDGVDRLGSTAGEFGATKVYVVRDESLRFPLPEPRVDILEKIVAEDDYDTILFSNSVLASDIAGGLAARLNAGINWDLIDLEVRDGILVGKRLALEDSISVENGWRSSRRLGMFRSGSFEALKVPGDAAVIEITPPIRDDARDPQLVSHQGQKDEGPAFEDAKVIVAGGMGLGAAEHFSLAEELAEALGGMVGATRAAVYAGWRPHTAQIGQTGKKVTPNLYVALGISGAIQHKVGMQNSKVVIAINKDPHAPIFDVSDLAVIGDVHVVVPKLIELLGGDQIPVTVRPAEYPPPFESAEFVLEPTDDVDTRIEVGILVVGAGPAGLACAIRFAQLLAENPTIAEELGDVPLAVLEKGKQPGSHLLSGAVVNPRSLRKLFGDQFRIEDIPNYGTVGSESVLVLSSKASLPIPPPPSMRNHGNVIVSLSELGHWLADQAEQAGAMILPETVAQALLIEDGRVLGVRTGDKGRDASGETLGNFESGVDIVAKVTVLAEGTQGHLTNVALEHFDLGGTDPQVWELGVKEVWQVPKPLDRIIHTMGWPLRTQAKYREFGGSFIYPIGQNRLTIGMVVGLDYRDSELSVHDLLQELKTHPKIKPLLEGGERLEWGAKTIPSGGFHALPRSFHTPGLLLCGDGAGMVNIPALKGVHYAIESGRLAAESAFKAMTNEETSVAALASYDEAIRSSFLWSDLREVRDMRQVFGRGFFVGGVLASAMAISKGRVHLGRVRSERDDEQPLLRTGRAARYPKPDDKLTFDKLTSVFAAGNKTRDDQPDHLRTTKRVPPEIAQMWIHMCPAQVYSLGEVGQDGLVGVDVAALNCVQCGAISARGGRFTPPEGGSGPEYTTT